MSDTSTPTKTIVLDQLAKDIKNRIHGLEVDNLVQFSKQIFNVLPYEELIKEDRDRLCAKVLSLWQMFHKRSDNQPQVSVFNPTIKDHGWHSSFTIIQIVCCDMPFIVDSISMALTQQQCSIHSLCNGVIGAHRHASGELIGLLNSDSRKELESVIYIEIDRRTNCEFFVELREKLMQVLSDVTLVTDDHQAMLAKINELNAGIHDCEEIDQLPDAITSRVELAALLNWLERDNFIFLAYKTVLPTLGDVPAMVPESGLGLWRATQAEHASDTPRLEHSVDPVFFCKDQRRSCVHRYAHGDYIGFREFNVKGEVIKEHHFLGLFTSRVYRQPLQAIPVIRKKVSAVLSASGFDLGGHSYKQLQHILDDLPRDELLYASVDELLSMVIEVFNLGKRRTASLFIRPAQDSGYYSCLYYVPRDLFNTALRQRVQDILVSQCNAIDVEVSAQFSESVLFRTHFMVYVGSDQAPVDPAVIAAKVMAVSRSWDDDLRAQLIENAGDEQGNGFHSQFSGGFPSAYKEHFSPATAADDVEHLCELSSVNRLLLRFYQPLHINKNELRFKIYSVDEDVILSDVIPIFERLGMRVLREHPYAIECREGSTYGISDFKVSCVWLDSSELQTSKQLLQTAFAHIWTGLAENDRFNELIICARIQWRDVALLRAYARYMKQLRFGFSQSFIAATLTRYPVIARQLVALFHTRFNPEACNQRDEAELAIEQDLLEKLESVDSLDDDRILRRYVNLIKATLRTNFFQQINAEFKAYFSFKLNPQMITGIALPCPKFEVFIYSPRVEGVHLRSGSVARGGLRWSDRLEDYRTEVLGLVKAQQVKNSVIVPTGAKGCFIVKQPPQSGSRDAIQEEGIACYQLYIRGLLDITDNLIEGEVIAPTHVIRYDGDDTYLVVAADKGTATFSDIANQLSNDYGFWLRDAFASGGSDGYDHKKMGITAKGAWESVKRHFYELGTDVQSEEFSVLGIGDMGGDVFGNGMLLSKKIRLIAAFNHTHIFIDPNPNVDTAYKERARLFELPRSSWQDYDPRLLSRGGGIYRRASKWVSITPEIKRLFGITANRLTPNDLIHELLKSPVDLLWNGGIGTYVKASDETHADVGDKANDNLRVNGCQLRCKVLGEGGNLGATQLGRIEFAQHGGAANTDFIDNAGGVDCSDHEVNIKILLNELVLSENLTLKQRNQLLRDMSDDVGALVLKNNYRQALALTIAETSAVESIDDCVRLIKRLEKEEKLDRTLEFLPSNKALYKRKEDGKGLTRPELSVLISYCKIELKQAITRSWLTADVDFSSEMKSAFPKRLIREFPEAVNHHRLRREITATQIANDLVNRMGVTFVDRMRNVTGADYSQIAAAYLIVREVFDIEKQWSAIESLNNGITSAVKVEMMKSIMTLVRRACYWFLRHHRYSLDLPDCVASYKAGVGSIVGSVDVLASIIPRNRWQAKFDYFNNCNVPELLSAFCASAVSQYWLLDIIEIARRQNRTIDRVAAVYFQLGGDLSLIWLDDEIRRVKPTNHWQMLASISYRNDLDHQLRALTASVFNSYEVDPVEECSTQTIISHWYRKKHSLILRWEQTLQAIKDSKVTDYAAFSVALSVLLELI